MLNLRAMEVLDDVGVADAIGGEHTRPDGGNRGTTPASWAPIPTTARCLHRLESWGAGGAEHWSAASPWRQLTFCRSGWSR